MKRKREKSGSEKSGVAGVAGVQEFRSSGRVKKTQNVRKSM
jgi:hypothetical protein